MIKKIKGNKLIGSALFVMFLMAAVFYYFPFFDSDQIDLRDVLYLFSALVPVLGGVYAMNYYGWGNVRAKTILFLTLGFLGTLIGEFLWILYDSVLGIDPFPSIADLFFLIFYPFVCLSLFNESLLAQDKKSKLSSFSIILIVLFSLALIAAVVYFGIFLTYDVDSTFVENVFVILYGVVDLFLVLFMIFVLKVTFAYKGGQLFYSWMFFFVGLLSLLTADVLFGMYSNAYEDGAQMIVGVIDMLWITSFLFNGYAMFSMGNIVRSIGFRMNVKMKKS